MFKDIPGFEGLYQISIDGVVKSLERLETQPIGRHEKPFIRIRKERLVKIGSHGRYKTVNLSKNGKQQPYLLHRLLALTFIENPFNKSEVNHIDGDRFNNCLSNLEWSTRKENALHSTQILKKNRGADNSSKLTEEDVKQIVILYQSGFNQTEISKLFNVTNSCVYRIIHGDNWAWLTGIGKEGTCDRSI